MLFRSAPIQTIPILERYLLKKIFKHNKKVFLLCCGVDYLVAKHLIEKKERYSIMNPFFENPKSVKEYQFILDFLSDNHKKTHNQVYDTIEGVIASDIDYINPIKEQKKYKGLIGNPVNTDTITFKENTIKDKIIIFLGINRGTYYSKGISFFEESLSIIKEKYADTIEIIMVENIPYKEYIIQFDKAHIILDQVFGLDQGYNALEAMAKGKVVFTGAENEFESHYNVTEKVAINALPNVSYLVNQLEFLIENPNEIIAIGKRARAFIEKEHHYKVIASKYLKTWEVLCNF